MIFPLIASWQQAAFEVGAQMASMTSAFFQFSQLSQRTYAHMSATQFSERFHKLYDQVSKCEAMPKLTPDKFMDPENDILYSPLIAEAMVFYSDRCIAFDFAPLRDVSEIADQVLISGNVPRVFIQSVRHEIDNFSKIAEEIRDLMQEGRSSESESRAPAWLAEMYREGKDLLDLISHIEKTPDPELTLQAIRKKQHLPEVIIDQGELVAA